MGMSAEVKDTRGYHDNAAQHIERWDGICFSELHAGTIHFLPHRSPDVLDTGAGSGRDAASLATLGHKVAAVEPFVEFRHAGAAPHSSSALTWSDSSLPDLNVLRASPQSFDVVMLTVTWMHLGAEERTHPMPIPVLDLRDERLMLMTLRRGPKPAPHRILMCPPTKRLLFSGGRLAARTRYTHRVSYSSANSTCQPRLYSLRIHCPGSSEGLLHFCGCRTS
jgi:hypothetical protein